MTAHPVKLIEAALEKDWSSAEALLRNEFSLKQLMLASDPVDGSVTDRDWHSYFGQLTLNKSRIRLARVGNDNEIVDLREEEIDYVVGGAAAVPILGVAVVIVGLVALAVAVHVVVGGMVSVIAWAAVHVTGPGIYEPPVPDPDPEPWFG